jgi:hypothetical protein
MVQLIDFNRIDVIKVDENELTTIMVEIDKDGLLDYSSADLYALINDGIRSSIARGAFSLNDNLWFKIIIKDNTIDNDDLSLYFLCANIIAANLLVGEMRDREPRLKVPTIIDTEGLFGLFWLRRMVNEKITCDKIGGVIKVNDKEVKIV